MRQAHAVRCATAPLTLAPFGSGETGMLGVKPLQIPRAASRFRANHGRGPRHRGGHSQEHRAAVRAAPECGCGGEVAIRGQVTGETLAAPDALERPVGPGTPEAPRSRPGMDSGRPVEAVGTGNQSERETPQSGQGVVPVPCVSQDSRPYNGVIRLLGGVPGGSRASRGLAMCVRHANSGRAG